MRNPLKRTDKRRSITLADALRITEILNLDFSYIILKAKIMLEDSIKTHEGNIMRPAKKLKRES